MKSIYLMDRAFLDQLLADRREIMAVAKSLGTADAMREAGAEVLRAANIHVAPKTPEEALNLYAVDAEGVAHIPMVGELTPQAKTDICGAYTAEALTEYGFIQAAALAADADPRVNMIAFEANTPGGYLEGLDQTAQVMAGLKKPTVTYVQNALASAGVWLAAQTDRIVASSPADKIGSIGVAAEIDDNTAALAQRGITRHVLTSTDAPNKLADVTTDAGKAQIKQMLDATHAIFVQRVSDGRGVSQKRVNEDFGRGALMTAVAAQKVGMIDEVRGITLSRPDSEKPAGVAGVAAQKAASHSQGVPMTIEELKKEHPDLYAAVLGAGKEAGVQEGVALGVTQERARVQALQKWADADAENAKVIGIVKEAQATGKSEADVMPQLQVAIRGAGLPVGDIPPAVNTANPANGGNAIGGAMSAEDRAYLKDRGYTDVEIAKLVRDIGKEKK